MAPQLWETLMGLTYSDGEYERIALATANSNLRSELMRLEHEIERLRNALTDRTLLEWLEEGWNKGWATGPVCLIHDGAPMTDDEWSEDDACITVVRVLEDEITRAAVLAEHAPSTWRATNLFGHGLPLPSNRRPSD